MDGYELARQIRSLAASSRGHRKGLSSHREAGMRKVAAAANFLHEARALAADAQGSAVDFY